MQVDQSIFEKESLFGFNETVELLLNAATDREWNNPATHDLQNSLAKAGKSILPVTVLEVCKPEYSGQMLELSDERIVSVMMPCRISVYEKADGKTYVATVNYKLFTTGQSEVIRDVMMEASNDLEEIVRAVAR